VPLPRPVAAFAVCLVLVPLASCGDGDAATPTPPTTQAPRSTTAAPETTTTEPAPAYRSRIASIRPDVASVVVHESPGGPQLQLDTAGDGTLRPVTVPNPLPSGAPTTFLVEERGTDADGAEWLRVHLPVRPNESLGWIPATDADVRDTDMAAAIDLGDHLLTLTDAGRVVATYPVAVGLPDTPTPTGRFYVKELVEPTNGNGAYGPIAYGLSAFSPTLVDTEAFADGVIGIHGTKWPQLIGTDVSHGCVRMRNEDILDVEAHQVPLGMPVTITA